MSSDKNIPPLYIKFSRPSVFQIWGKESQGRLKEVLRFNNSSIITCVYLPCTGDSSKPLNSLSHLILIMTMMLVLGYAAHFADEGT